MTQFLMFFELGGITPAHSEYTAEFMCQYSQMICKKYGGELVFGKLVEIYNSMRGYK